MKTVIYVNRVNLCGLYHHKPIRCVLDDENDFYYSSEFDFIVDEVGEVFSDGRVDFASVNRSDVEHWTNGVKAAMGMLNKWSRTKGQ